MSHEIYCNGKLAETLEWDGPAFAYPEPEDVARERRRLKERAVARAYAIGGLSFERRSPGWLESDHDSFTCVEIGPDEVAATTPLGVFKIKARRARRGELKTAVRVGTFSVGICGRALENQESLPVKLNGRLSPPRRRGERWYFQPSCFVYADGSSSDFLGSDCHSIEWVAEPAWDLID